MKKIVIVGSGGFAKEIAFLIEMINCNKLEWEIGGFIDNAINTYNGKYKINNNDSWLEKYAGEIYVVFGAGNPSLLRKFHNKFKFNKNIKFPNLIHPNAIGDWERIQIGEGNIITSGVNFTTDIKIGSFNVFNLGCTIGHDTIIGDYNVFNPLVNLSGGLIIDDEILVGTGAQILQNIKMKNNIVIGAGAVVTKDLLMSGVYTGIPAKLIIK
jgi:sugar O-acyltransferase (sialic acid O-acetyltransferase NeuD family)